VTALRGFAHAALIQTLPTGQENSTAREKEREREETMFEWSIRLGDVIQLVAFIAAVLAAFYKLEGDVRVLKHDFASMKASVELLSAAMKSFGDVLSKIAVQENRLDQHEKLIDELRHGEGLVTDRHRR
jgi:hypothetical protein